jgi:hypothetical protein
LKTFTLNLEDEMFAKIAAIAKQAGIAEQDIEEWFAQQVQQSLSILLPSGSSQWMPRERWDALVRGENCVFCAQLARDDDFDGYGLSLRISRLHVSSLPGTNIFAGNVFLPTNTTSKSFMIFLSRNRKRETYAPTRGSC